MKKAKLSNDEVIKSVNELKGWVSDVMREHSRTLDKVTLELSSAICRQGETIRGLDHRISRREEQSAAVLRNNAGNENKIISIEKKLKEIESFYVDRARTIHVVVNDLVSKVRLMEARHLSEDRAANGKAAVLNGIARLLSYIAVFAAGVYFF